LPTFSGGGDTIVTMVFEPATLHLRFSDDAARSGPPAPPDVEAFLGRPPASADPQLEDEFGVLPGDGPVDPAGPLVIFLQHPEFGIPAPGHDGLPDLGSWSVRPTIFGWLASISPPTRSAGPRRACQVLAGCLALTLPIPGNALADAPASPPQPVQAPAAATTSARTPAAPTTSTRAPASPPAIVPASPTTSAPTPAPAPASVPTPPVTTEPAEAKPTPPPPRVQDTRVLEDAAWDGIDGFVVVVVLKGGKNMRGRVGAVQADTFTFIDSADGQILVIPKSGVQTVRAYVPPPLPTQNGGGLIAGGSVLTALGVPVFLTGIAFVAICPSCTYLHIPMLVVGGGAMGGGIPMIAKGVKRRTAFQKALEEHRVVPMVSRTPGHGWTGGLQFRF
jgi:hypothetical protein